jgi:hypothetical protein
LEGRPFSRDLLGRHVFQCAAPHIDRGPEESFREPCHAEIGNLHVLVCPGEADEFPGDQYVFRFDLAVNDLLIVQIYQSFTDLHGRARYVIVPLILIGKSWETFLETSAEIEAIYIFRYEIASIVVDKEIVASQDVIVLERTVELDL